uniref:Uncharacterized protein n=1 Tax=Panagrolaimus superbus TaxID=310955 RepID=A0A914XT29_9BILA
MSSNTSSPSFTFSSDITFTLPLNQCYPTNIFKWMKKNAKPRMSLKLMQISKYFCYQRCPYLFTHNLEWFSEDDAFYYFHSHCYPNTRKKMKNSDKNLWLTGLLMLRQYPYILPKLIKCVIVCDVTFIHFEQQQIDFNDFKILTASGSVEILHCYGWTKIVDNFGEISPLEDILECLPNLKRLVL